MRNTVILGFDMESDLGSYTKDYSGFRHGTQVIFRLLEKYSIRATFFFTGDAALQNREAVREAADRGFEVGCHSLKHETVGDAHFNMPNDAAILDEEVEHRWEFADMPERIEYDEGVFQFKTELVQNCGKTMEREFEKLLRLSLDNGYTFLTCADFFELWRKEHG